MSSFVQMESKHYQDMGIQGWNLLWEIRTKIGYFLKIIRNNYEI